MCAGRQALMLRGILSQALLAGLAVAWLASPAEAQIYSWRNGDGTLVLSNIRPKDIQSVQSYAVPASEGLRATREVPVERARIYDDLIVEHARRNGVRQSLVRAVVQVESAFNPLAYSNKGAMGLMQLMPATARQFGVRNAFDPEQNVRAGVAYLRQLLDRYGDNEELALAAYNAGPGAVDTHGQRVPPYRETKDYVSKVNGIAGEPTTVAHTELYKSIEIIDVRAVVKYSDKKPR
jgi:soluble lytic murein transglycosylase-like protein